MTKNLPAPLPVKRIIGGLILLLALFSAAALPVSAQSAGAISVTGLDFSTFPAVSFMLQVTDTQGKIVADLQPDQLQILEDGYARPVTELARVQPGAQVILAINESPTLTYQMQGLSYYRIFHETLDAWAAALPQGSNDNYSYVTNSGIQIDRQTDTRVFAQMLAAYEVDLIGAQPGLTSLTMSLDMTTDPLPDPYMKRAILYVTPMLDAASRQSLPSIAERAAQLGTRVFVWLVAPEYALESAEVTPFRELADLSGGEIFLFNGSESFPDPEHYLEPLRNIYRTTYRSGVTSSGGHNLSVSVMRPDLQVTGEQMSFNLQLAAPNPMFLEPPAQIERLLTGAEDDQTLEPRDSIIRILVEFPDGYPRNLTASRLYVNDQLAAENLAAPFDQFSLPLSAYEQDTQLHLRAEVVDELGLSASSIDTLVQVRVQQPDPTLLEKIFTGRGLSILIAVSMASLVLGLVIYFTSQSNIKRAQPKTNGNKHDPLTQPVLPKSPKRKPSRPFASSPTLRRQSEPLYAPARLVRLSADGNPIPERVIPIIRRETTLGSDPQAATCVLDNPTVSGKHARLFQNSEGKYFVSDNGSVAGTWVNYNSVNGEGYKLSHCDIIHFGLMAFRFEMNNPDSEQIPEISPLKAAEL
jgi:hypothetical protein